jgi:hypothetical protein
VTQQPLAALLLRLPNLPPRSCQQLEQQLRMALAPPLVLLRPRQECWLEPQLAPLLPQLAPVLPQVLLLPMRRWLLAAAPGLRRRRRALHPRQQQPRVLLVRQAEQQLRQLLLLVHQGLVLVLLVPALLLLPQRPQPQCQEGGRLAALPHPSHCCWRSLHRQQPPAAGPPRPAAAERHWHWRCCGCGRGPAVSPGRPCRRAQESLRGTRAAAEHLCRQSSSTKAQQRHRQHAASQRELRLLAFEAAT